MNPMKRVSSIVALVTMVTGGVVSASSHREAPFVTKNPAVDSTDFTNNPQV